MILTIQTFKVGRRENPGTNPTIALRAPTNVC